MGKIRIIAKFHGTDLVICVNFREGKTLSFNRRNSLPVSSFLYILSHLFICILFW